jgi:hypothetical protein
MKTILQKPLIRMVNFGRSILNTGEVDNCPNVIHRRHSGVHARSQVAVSRSKFIWFGTSKSAISDLKNQQFARALTTEDFGTMRGAGSVLKLVLIVSASPMAMSKTCLASWRADAWPYRLSLAGHEFPSENHHKNDYSGDISPSAALLELLMVYHGAPHKPYYGIV